MAICLKTPYTSVQRIYVLQAMWDTPIIMISAEPNGMWPYTINWKRKQRFTDPISPQQWNIS